ncbi:MAG: hypothetical protein ABR986_01790 [Methanomassiliicoccales archaeon]
MERRTDTVIRRSRGKGDAIVALVIVAMIILIVIFMISLVVVGK